MVISSSVKPKTSTGGSGVDDELGTGTDVVVADETIDGTLLEALVTGADVGIVELVGTAVLLLVGFDVGLLVGLVVV